MSLIKVDPSEAKFREIEYLLKLSLGVYEVSNLRIARISRSEEQVDLPNPFARVEPKLDGWINLADLGDQNKIENICYRNFTMPVSGSGLPFTTGALRLQRR